jgi:subtilisin family serine protease
LRVEEFLEEWNNASGTVLVHTSGSTGEPKPMLVEKRRMLASARRTNDFLGLREGDTALLCMSLDYIAGKMMVVRAQERGLRLVSVEPSGHPLASAQPVDFAAMVPMQVYNSLQVPEERERLKQIRHLIIGGGAIDEALAAELKTFPHAVWSTYGMTETLSHVALRRLNGPDASEWYSPFDSVHLSLSDEGCLVIDAPEVCPETLVTNDIAELRPDGMFRILGRKDNVICSGGIKIQAEEVERQLRPHLHVPYLITKRPDEKFGEVVVLLTEGSSDEARTVCEHVLSKYHQPRAYMHTDQIPLTETGKPARNKAALLVRSLVLMMLLALSLVMPAQKKGYAKLSSFVQQALVENRTYQQTRSINHKHPSSDITAFVRIDGTQADDILRKYGCRKYAQWDDIVIASIPLDKVDGLASEQAVRRIEASRRATLQLDTTAVIINVPPVYETSDNHPAFTGAGVVVGVMDIGFDLTHPNFYDASTTRYRIGAFWDQLSKDTIGSPLPVGRDYIGQDNILAIGQSSDAPSQTHGTHTLGIAAGSGYDSKYRGMAYESDICLVSNAVTTNVEYIDSADLYKYTSAIDALGMKYCFDYAQQQGKPCVLSFSEGYNPYLDEDDSLYSAVLDHLSGPGHIIVSSAGNEGMEKTYFEKTATQQEAGAFIRCYKESAIYRLTSAEPFSLMFYCYQDGSGMPTDTLSFVTPEIPYDSIMSKVLICGEDTLSVYVYRGTSSFIDEDVYQVLMSANRTLNTLPQLALVVAGDGLVKVYGGSRSAFTSRDTDLRWTAAQKGHNILAPGCFPSVICAGGTSHRLQIMNEQGDTVNTVEGSVAGLVGPYSSTGPTMGGLMKPDVVAPGVNVVSSYSHVFNLKNNIVSWSDFQGERYPWAADSGTSMSTPVVAGIIALWLQAKPDLTPEEVHQVMSKSCSHPDTTLVYPNNDYGYGEINAYQGLLEILGLSKIKEISMYQSQTVRVRPEEGGIRLFFDDAPQEPVVVKVYDLSGVCVHSERLRTVGTEATIAMPSYCKGVYAVQIDCVNRKMRGSSLVRM